MGNTGHSWIRGFHGPKRHLKLLPRNLVDAECILSRRDSMIVARHEVPGKASLQRTVP
jgi:hypothetical protein